MPRRRIRAHYKKMSEFERGCIIGMKERGWANWRIDCHMGRSDVDIRRCWQEWVDNGRLQRYDVVVNLRPQIERTYWSTDQLSQRLIHRYQPSDV
ncbi:HTH_Tnp_Tc3_2 domain-containing protein [Trichonephila clavipes]|nr:HTH_Tnp_Tc3_2 domain-containing protein [Trichonephila clavipes]